MSNLQNTSLKAYNTFGIDVAAEHLISIESTGELVKTLAEINQKELLILGGGSNVLFMNDFKGTVLLNKLEGISVVDENEGHVWVKAGGGVNWHEFVLHCIHQNWAGIENLSLIPGSVGAAPMQNIGAYGVEIKNVFHELEAVEISSGKIKTFSNKECQFGYRESVFKRALKGQYLISSVIFKLDKKPTFKTSYGAITNELENMKVTELSIQAISNAVINIRQSKLPDPKVTGNAGSFFKNPVVPISLAENIKKEYPEAAAYPLDDNSMKLAAGWLIDKAGWKGKTYGNYGVHPKQALVLVNYGGATGQNIYDLSTEILTDIKSKFGVELEREVNIVR
ncbi:MAG: UDP-N-acetylmuramate dehydrogenase [Flavobacteriales bacterium]|jgi:UDP-N-acetylmuramate dehydrogenase